MALPFRTLTRSLTGFGRASLGSAAVLALAVGLVEPAAWGQASTIDRAILTASTPLDGAKNTALKDFVTRWTEDLSGSSDPAEVTAARNALIEPARDPSATPIFRRSYSQAVLAELKPVVTGKDLRRAVNALQIARFLRSPEAVDLIVERISPTAESDQNKRLAAASTLAAAVTDADLSPVQCDGITRDLLAAATAEKDDQVLVQEMKVLAGISRRSGLPAASAEAALAAQVKVFTTLADSVAASPKADARMTSVARALVMLRNQWLDLPRPLATKVGPSLGRPIGTVLQTADGHWETARSDPETQSAYEIGVATSETLLRLVDRIMRPTAYPAPKPGVKDDEARVLASSWTGNMKDAFSAEVKRWMGIIGAAPYTAK
jgi:hypothetical protein